MNGKTGVGLALLYKRLTHASLSASLVATPSVSPQIGTLKPAVAPRFTTMLGGSQTLS